jgi:AcrR family transcriptional regulator
MAPRPKTRAEQKQTTRAHLVRAGRRVFTKHGYDATTVGMLCDAAKVTHGALYHHFPSKLDLFVAVAAEITGEVAKRVGDAAERAEGWDQVDAACAAYLDACTEPDVAAIFLRDAPRVIPPEKFAEIDHAANEPLVTGLLRRWIAAGLMRPVPVEVLARLLGAAFAEAGAAIATADAPAETRRDVEAILDAWIATLRAEPGSD